MHWNVAFVLIPLAVIALIVWTRAAHAIPQPAAFVVLGMLVVLALGLLDAGLLPSIRI